MSLLTPAIINCAVVMMKRATCKGEEAKNVAITIDLLEAEAKALEQAAVAENEGGAEEKDVNDS